MTDIFIILLLFTLLVLLLALFALVVSRVSSLVFTGGAPYIQVPDEVLDSIVRALNIGSGSKVYDLGCGDGRVLRASYLNNPEAEYVGIDSALFPVIEARLRIKKLKAESKIKVIKADIFKSDISDATHIFLYLYPNIINSLLPRLNKELKKGARVVSCDYPFDNKKPKEIIDLNRRRGQLAKFLYIYEF